MPITPSWLKVEHSSFENQRTAFTAALITCTVSTRVSTLLRNSAHKTIIESTILSKHPDIVHQVTALMQHGYDEASCATELHKRCDLELVRHPVLAQTDTQSTSDALKFALAQWTAYDWHLILRDERRTYISKNLRYTRVRAIERCHRLTQLRSTRAYDEHSTSVQHTLQLPALSTGNVHYDAIVQRLQQHTLSEVLATAQYSVVGLVSLRAHLLFTTCCSHVHRQ
eukprot:7380-Heterococcus_DN1.PRE.2